MTATWWWWVGLSDPRRPKGEQALGAVIVQGPEEAHAGVQVRALLGMALDHVELYIGRMPPEHGDPPPGYVGRVLSRREAEILAKAWIPNGRLASPEEVRAAIMNDDEAKEGSLLFGGGGGK